jgi:hypothetical protein
MKRAILFGATLQLTTSLALAQTAGADHATQAGLEPAPPAVHVVDDDEPKLPLVPRATDLLGRHLLIGAALGPTWSLGKLASNVAAVRGLDTGLALNADAGFGLSRSVAAGVWGNFAAYGDGDACDSCSGKSFAVGPFVRYHLSQGLRFDPWLALGAGYRQVSYETLGVKNEFSGAEWLKLNLGADYYLLSGLGFGPYGSFGLSSYWSRPDTTNDAAVTTELSFGLRLLLDVPGR